MRITGISLPLKDILLGRMSSNVLWRVGGESSVLSGKAFVGCPCRHVASRYVVG